MTMVFSTRGTYPVEPDQMLRVLSHPEVLVQQKLDQGALKATVTELERSQARLVQRVDTIEYHRGMTGRDVHKQVPAETRYEWDLAARRCHWRYHGERGERVRLEGRMAVAAHADGAEVESGFEVQVRAPLIGRAIEAVIVRELEAGLPAFDALLKAWCQKVE